MEMYLNPIEEAGGDPLGARLGQVQTARLGFGGKWRGGGGAAWEGDWVSRIRAALMLIILSLLIAASSECCG